MIGVAERTKTQLGVTPSDFETVLHMLDKVYDAAMSGRLCEASSTDRRLITGWLRDILYTTDEILQEIENCGGGNYEE